MKKVLLALLVSLGLQTQAQVNYCDSLTITGSQNQMLVEVNNLNTFIYWITTAPDGTVLGEDSTALHHTVFNYNPVIGLSYDTITTCIAYGAGGSYVNCCVTFIWNGTMWMKIGTQPMNLCDSVSYTILSGSGGNTTLQLNGIITPGFQGTILMWEWQVCDDALCYADTNQIGIFNQFTTTDTLKACLTTLLMVNNMIYTCTQCDSLIYGPAGWMMMNMGNPTAITELELNTNNDGKIYDLLGRELTDVPIGVMYIQNRKLIIKQ